MAEDWRETAWRRVGTTLVPRLSNIPREHWREALIPLDRIARDYAVYDHYLTREQIADAAALVEALPPPPSEAIRTEVPRVGRASGGCSRNTTSPSTG